MDSEIGVLRNFTEQCMIEYQKMANIFIQHFLLLIIQKWHAKTLMRYIFTYNHCQHMAVSKKKNKIPFPFNFRPILFFWRVLFFKKGEFRPDRKKTSAYNRGAYLVEGAMHCGMCHTPSNWLGAQKQNFLEAWFQDKIGSLQPSTQIKKWYRKLVLRWYNISSKNWNFSL